MCNQLFIFKLLEFLKSSRIVYVFIMPLLSGTSICGFDSKKTNDCKKENFSRIFKSTIVAIAVVAPKKITSDTKKVNQRPRTSEDAIRYPSNLMRVLPPWPY